jgi:copper oxidase (laccase) domain-containing protein
LAVVTVDDSFLAPLRAIPGVWAGWCPRFPGVDSECDRDEAMRRLRPFHEAWLTGQGGGGKPFWRAEQVHGNRVAVVPGAETIEAADGLPCVPGVDGLVTGQSGITLGVYVADCGPIWLVDPVRRVVGLLHSGKKGTESDILGVALDLFTRDFGSCPEDIIAVLGPCIRPPDYEVDFAVTIAMQAERRRIGGFFDCRVNTATDLVANYSYRRELGKTGRMLAAIRLES